jgi:hypothetical protein
MMTLSARPSIRKVFSSFTSARSVVCKWLLRQSGHKYLQASGLRIIAQYIIMQW